jgi:hypothetical protein
MWIHSGAQQWGYCAKPASGAFFELACLGSGRTGSSLTADGKTIRFRMLWIYSLAFSISFQFIVIIGVCKVHSVFKLF